MKKIDMALNRLFLFKLMLNVFLNFSTILIIPKTQNGAKIMRAI